MELGNYIPCCESYFWVLLTICVILLLFASITSGLALGLLSFNLVDLEVLVKSGQPQAQKNAAKILPLVKKEHFLLCTLLAGKTLALEALPIVLHTIFPTWCAIIVSLIFVLAFVEIIPQAVFSRYGLSVGAKLSTLVQLLMLIFFPLSYPISKLLDLLLGREHSVLRRRVELKTLVDLHAKEAGKGGELLSLETAIITGALDLTEKTAKDVMTPISRIFSLDINSKFTMQIMNLIRSKGHSRIPVYSGDPKNVIGLILVKNLISCHPEDEIPIKYMTLRRMPRIYDDWPLYDVLNHFLKGQSHMAVIVRSKKKNMNEEIENNVLDRSALHHMNTNSNVDPNQSSRNGLIFPLAEKEDLSISTETSSLHSIEMEFQNKTLGTIIEQDKNFQSKYKKSQGEQNTDSKDLMSFPRYNDEEIIGIITLEDVLEALLQENILDETDYAYLDVHNKITINPMHTRRWSSKSSGTASSPYIQGKNLETSLYSQAPKRRSQSFSYTSTTPIIPCSFEKSVPNSPAALENHINHHKISRMSREDIQLHNDK